MTKIRNRKGFVLNLKFRYLILFGICFLLFGTSHSARADFSPQSIVESKNVLSGATVTAINGFQVNATVPAGATASVKFTQDKVNYYNSSGVKGEWDALVNGLNNLDLSGLGWTGGILFYKIQLTSADGTATAIISDVQVDYDGTEVPPLSGNSYPMISTVVSTDLLSSGAFDFDNTTRFAYNITSLPDSTSVTAQFSQDGITWYSSDGTLWGEDALEFGSHLDSSSGLDLSALNWEGATSFYYKFHLHSPLDDNLTPTISDAGLIKPDPVYFSVGQSASDFKTGVPTVSISNGTATFSEAQTGNIGVGDEILYNVSSIAYIAGKISQTQWKVVTATGGVPTDITDSTVVSITRVFTSLASAEATAPTLLGTSDLVAGNYQLNFPCYYDSGADTSTLAVNGYVTGRGNYIKIYTPDNTVTEANVSQRHNGKWDEGKYRFEATVGSGPSFSISDEYVEIDGLQIYNPAVSGAIDIWCAPNSDGSIIISNNIIRGGSNANYGNIYLKQGGGAQSWKIYNNIIYDSDNHGIRFASSSGTHKGYIANNTVTDTNTGIYGNTSNIETAIYNNISVNNNRDYYLTAGTSPTNNNISSDATAPGTNSKISTTVDFVSNISGNEDFHLAPTDTAARDAGVDLSADANLAFNTDIDGNIRDSSVTQWDIGADEAATQIYRSVGPSATAVLASDGAHTRNVTVIGGVATFSAALANNIGVGDVVLIDTDNNDAIGSADTLLFIHGRTDSTHYTLRTHTGAMPIDIATNDTYAIYRAHTSLANAESGTVNSTLSGLGFSFNGGNRDLVANNEQWNIAAYANGMTADTSGVSIHGWNTGAQNYIKVYTPVSANEVGVSQRHSGKWEDGKYKMLVNHSAYSLRFIGIYDSFVRIEGLQLEIISDAYEHSGFTAYCDDVDGYIDISRNIIKATFTGTANGSAIMSHSTSFSTVNISNNITYGIGISGTYGGPEYIFNNTVYNGSISGNSNDIAKNNIVQNSNNGFIGVFNALSDFNISDILDDAPNATFTGGFAEVQFVDEANYDFHLAPTDIAAKDAGADLSADTNLPITTDIDGNSRDASINAFDIGADETATQIFRSVGPGATGVLSDDSSHARNVTVTAGEATFSTALADNIGVGDAVLIDTGGTDQTIDASDTILFIHGRTDSTHYTLRTHTGAVPGDIATNDTYAIYRAYTSLASAESGTKNTSIPMTFNGGNRDLVANNEQWNIACYANGTTADTTAVVIDGWSTGAQNSIKLYTPVNSNEVGVSQRHRGRWDEGNYRLELNGDLITVLEENVYVDGLQIYKTGTGGAYGLIVNSIGAGRSIIKNNIIRGPGNTASEHGIHFGVDAGKIDGYIYNNIVYDFLRGVWPYAFNKIFIYNNSVYNCSDCFKGVAILVKNNIAQNCTDGFSGTFSGLSEYNISDLAGDAPGANSKNSTEVQFVDEANGDFHLAQSDTAARGAGANLTNDANLPFATDIDGQLRNPVGDGWDIGADEGTVEFTPTVMQSGGDYSSLASWEAGVQTDLVASTTRVFAHGGVAGVVADDVSVTGLTSGATATVVHATVDQILLENISGTFQSGEVVEASAGNNVTLSDNGNPASAVAKIDGAWTVADTTTVEVDGWGTGVDNYIKVYTTETARHQGKWDDGKYRLEKNNYSALNLNNGNFIVDGLQILISGDGSYDSGIVFESDSGKGVIKNNIIKAELTGGAMNNFGIWGVYNNKLESLDVYNNIIYDFVNVDNYNRGLHIYTTPANVYNNTFHNIGVSVVNSSNTRYVNNILTNCLEQCFEFRTAIIEADSSNNISSDGTAPGTNSKINTTVDFVSTEAGSEDFHLADTDAVARDAGADLSSYGFATDIDGNQRLSGVWDIGADEAATRIYRSVGPSMTGVLDDDSSHTKNITVTNGVATFSGDVPDNVGVGDVVLIDTDNNDAIGSADTLLFIHGRTDSTHYTLRTQTGAMPTDIAINDTYAIYRAHTSLANAEAGTINSTLSGLGFSFNGGNRDLVANNEQWNIAAYANGETADATEVIIDDWVIDIRNYLKIYTPVGGDEVGISQRHGGKWDDSKYKLSSSVGVIRVKQDNVKIAGLQLNQAGAFKTAILIDANNVFLNSNILRSSPTSYNKGINTIGVSGNLAYVHNNIIYGFENGLYKTNSYVTIYFYNNTVYGCKEFGVYPNYSDVIAKNNISVNNGVDYRATGGYTNSNNNISSDGTAPGTDSKINAMVNFVDIDNRDFHLQSNDTVAKDAGVDLNIDLNLYFSTDIDGDTRPVGSTWDIGADEAAFAESVKLRGESQFRGNVNFR